ncbi:MAG: LLM class flavin-dependent oxidoreductase [Alphaproteobacteria bacterium]|jgi:hypothetical protein|nr:LLM class flavin-dependent oxidoreductase [Alphaproteobacteria bacterium]
MRLGIVVVPEVVAENDGGTAATVARIRGIGRAAEELGFAGLWVTDSIGRTWPSLDPLMLLTALAGETRRIELGTGVLQLPLRHPVELAHRIQSLNLLAEGRLRLGVGAGSTEADFLAVEADYGARFQALPAALETMRRVWCGEAVYGPALPLWPGSEGGPPVLLGAWHRRRWIEMAARECGGWIASGLYTSWADLEAGIAMYRGLGGGRVVLANVLTDLRPEPVPHPYVKHSTIDLICSPEEARGRLDRLGDLGVDDVLLLCPFDAPEVLEQAAGLSRP